MVVVFRLFSECGSCVVFNLINFSFFGFLVILCGEVLKFVFGLSLIMFCDCSSSSVWLLLVGLFGRLKCVLFFSFFSDLIFFE